MSREVVGAFAAIAGSVAAAAGVAWAGGQGGHELVGVSVPLVCTALAFLVQWVAFVPAYLMQSERFYDLVGSLTYILVTAVALLAAPAAGPRALLLGALVVIWAARLGSFLFRRVHAAGSDGRFDAIKRSASRFLVAWTLQGLWVSLTLSAVLAATATRTPAELGPLDALGLAIWLFGFGIEVVADRQKSRFRVHSPGRFVDAGLWAWSRHPNYFGEITLWAGIAVIAASTLSGWQWVTLISPVFVALLIMRISGVPLLEQRADARWGEEDAYRRYKEATPVLFPRPPRRSLGAGAGR